MQRWCFATRPVKSVFIDVPHSRNRVCRF
jgi:hypothetical protein